MRGERFRCISQQRPEKVGVQASTCLGAEDVRVPEVPKASRSRDSPVALHTLCRADGEIFNFFREQAAGNAAARRTTHGSSRTQTGTSSTRPSMHRGIVRLVIVRVGVRIVLEGGALPLGVRFGGRRIARATHTVQYVPCAGLTENFFWCRRLFAWRWSLDAERQNVGRKVLSSTAQAEFSERSWGSSRRVSGLKVVRQTAHANCLLRMPTCIGLDPLGLELRGADDHVCPL